jgi:hypothetical protein
MISRDALRLDSPAAQAELKLLLALPVGATRRGVLLPALSVGVEWTLVESESGRSELDGPILVVTKPGRWVFDGTFFGQPLYRLVIRTDAALLTLEVESR